jgi:hypothetical protein
MRFQKKNIFILLAVFLADFLCFNINKVYGSYMGITTEQLLNGNQASLTYQQEIIQSFKASGEFIYGLEVSCQSAGANASATICLTNSSTSPASCLSYEAWFSCLTAKAWRFAYIYPPYQIASGTTLYLRFQHREWAQTIYVNGQCGDVYTDGQLTDRKLSCGDGDLAFKIYGIRANCPDCVNCSDCINNCICGETSGATTSTSTIISDTFLDDNDISTIKSVSGAVGDKNYTIYYFPFLLFIYIFIILIVCLSVIYIFKIIRKK